MKTEDLKAQGLTAEQIAFVMAENGKDIKREQVLQTSLLDAAVRFAGDFNSQYSGDRHRAVIDALNRVYGVKPACI